MRLDPSKLGADTLASIPNILLHPLVAKHGVKRYTLDKWRAAKPPKLFTVNVSNGERQPLYRSTVLAVLQAIQTNLGVNTEADQASL